MVPLPSSAALVGLPLGVWEDLAGVPIQAAPPCLLGVPVEVSGPLVGPKMEVLQATPGLAVLLATPGRGVPRSRGVGACQGILWQVAWEVPGVLALAWTQGVAAWGESLEALEVGGASLQEEGLGAGACSHPSCRGAGAPGQMVQEREGGRVGGHPRTAGEDDPPGTAGSARPAVSRRRSRVSLPCYLS